MAYLANHVQGVKENTTIGVKQFNHGQSNPTFLITLDQTQKMVLRKKPPGKLLRGAHAIEREYKIQEALYAQNFPVPKPIHFCKDASVIGTEFT